MVSQQQHEIIIKTRLMPRQLDDDALDHAAWVVDLRSVFIGKDGISAVVGRKESLVYDSGHRRWYHYDLPGYSRVWILGRDSARLWGLVGDGNLATLNLRSGELIEFKHRSNYRSILYAEKNTVIVQCKDILSIDVLRLQADGLQRIMSIPVPPLKSESVLEETKIAFWPEKEQFVVLERDYLNSRITLQTLSLDEQSKTVLDVVGHEPLLPLPFVAMLDEKKRGLIYADVRENPVKLKHIDLPFVLEWEGEQWDLGGAFAFGNSLIVALESEHHLDKQVAIIRLGEKHEVLFKFKFPKKGNSLNLLNTFDSGLLGRFLILGGVWAYDLVARQEAHNIPWSKRLRQAIRDEAKERQRVASTKQTLMLLQQHASSDVGDFKVFSRTSLYRFSKMLDQEENLFKDTDAISSSLNFSLFVHSHTQKKAYLLPSGHDQLKCLLPEPNYRWFKGTFDELGRLWVCDKRGKHIAIIHPDKQEGFGLVSPYSLSSEVRAIAAYNNILALGGFDEFVIHHYDKQGGFLKKKFSWRNATFDTAVIKPDIKKNGWWLVKDSYYKDIYYDLSYFSENDTAPRHVEITYRPFLILGDWPDKIYFVHSDKSKRTLHYTLDPLSNWHEVSLQSVVLGVHNNLQPVSMSSDGDSIFVLVYADDASLLIRLQADNAELISAFSTYSARFMRWGDWLVLYSEKPLAFDRAYANRAAITELPENKGILFFHLPTNQFCAKPYQPYAITDALRSMLGSGARGFLKSPL